MRNCNNLWLEWQIVSMNCRLSIFPLPDLPFSLSVSLIMNEIAQNKKTHKKSLKMDELSAFSCDELLKIMKCARNYKIARIVIKIESRRFEFFFS